MPFAKKLKKGSHIRVIAPSRSFKIISEETRKIALDRFAKLGIKVSYSKNADLIDDFVSSPIDKRIEDLHEAFADKSVDCILTAIGGYNSNQLLSYINYNLIKKNPKILCGFSDITSLTCAIYAKTGLVTYSGPHFSSFGMDQGFDYTLDYFKKTLMEDAPVDLKVSDHWSDDTWFLDQKKRIFIKNDSYWTINEGNAKHIKGKLIGGNLSTLRGLYGTEFMPSIKNSVLCIEDDEETNPVNFDRDLQSLIYQKDFKTVKAIIIGRFQNSSKIDRETLTKIIRSKKDLENIPVIANADFGHTTPILTLPVGGEIEIDLSDLVRIRLLKH